MFPKFSKPAVLVIALAGLTVACSSDEKKKPDESAVEVSVLPATQTAIGGSYETVGVIRSRTRSDVAARMIGDVRRVFVDEGDFVRAGQLLVEIDGREPAAAMERAEAATSEVSHALEGARAAKAAASANAAVAAATWERYQKLEERRSVSRQEIEEVEARYKAAKAEELRAEQALQQMVARGAQARAETSAARTQHSYARVTAPISGYVTARRVDAGDQAVPGMLLVTIEESGRFEVQASVEEGRAATLRAGDRVAVEVPVLKSRIDGTVRQVSPALDDASRSSLVKIDLPANPDLRSGLFARVAFAGASREAIAVPKQAVVRLGQLTAVWVAGDDSTAHFRLVTLGKENGDQVEILSGLARGERIIVSPLDGLSDGRRIAIRVATAGDVR